MTSDRPALDWSTLRRSPALSLPDRLSLDIERTILDGTLAPGERLPSEQALAQQLGASRVSVRQALRELEQRGLIDRRPGRGTTVRERGPSASDPLAVLLQRMAGTDAELMQIMELRALIEPPIAALAAARVTPRDIEQLRSLVVDMESEGDLDRYAQLDTAFHRAIAHYTHNPLMVQLVDLIAARIAPSRSSALQTSERRHRSNDGHRRIFAALEAHDAPAADAAARAHLEAVVDQMLRSTT